MKILRSGNLTPEDLKPAALVDAAGDRIAISNASLFTRDDVENVASFAAFAVNVCTQSGGSPDEAEQIALYCKDLATRIAKDLQR